MNLINITQQQISNELVETVNARELHAFLESKRQFANWIKGRIAQYGFEEGEDFTVNRFVIGRATQIDYHITVGMAKELAMVERNEKGKQARRYFIECEQRLEELQRRQEVEAKALRDRATARLESPELNAALQAQRLEQGKPVQHYLFSNEYNMLNRLILGTTAAGFRVEHGLSKADPVRDLLTPVQIEAMAKLQKLNTSLIEIGMEYDERKKRLAKYFDTHYNQRLIDEVQRLEA